MDRLKPYELALVPYLFHLTRGIPLSMLAFKDSNLLKNSFSICSRNIEVGKFDHLIFEIPFLSNAKKSAVAKIV